jgi:phosphatidylglycerophosphatase A
MSPGAELRSSDALTPPATVATRKPRFALFAATACGLGYIPLAPGTFGSLAGVLIYAWSQRYYPPDLFMDWVLRPDLSFHALWNAYIVLPLALLIAAVGVWASNRVAHFSGQKDPQYVVVDEVSGQMFTYLFAVAHGSWKYLLLGFILFRVFDIWKPFPARQAESLPGGWGIMADDWVAGIYAGIGLWIARAAGL